MAERRSSKPAPRASGKGGRVKSPGPVRPDSPGNQDFSPHRSEALGQRGKALWLELSKDHELTGGAGTLALEACRCADRLEELDAVIQGKGVLDLMRFRVLNNYISEDAQEIHVDVSFSNVLAEVRQQQMALRAMLTTLGAEKPVEKSKGSALDDLAARRAARVSDPTGTEPT